MTDLKNNIINSIKKIKNNKKALGGAIIFLIFSISIPVIITQKNTEKLNSTTSEIIQLLSNQKIDEALIKIEENKWSKDFTSKMKTVFMNYINKYISLFKQDNFSEEDLFKLIEKAYEITGDNVFNDKRIELEKIIEEKEAVTQSNKNYLNGVTEIENGNIYEGILKLKGVIQNDENYDNAKQLIEKNIPILRKLLIESINNNISNKNFDAANSDISKFETIFPNDEELKSFKESLKQYKEEYEKELQLKQEREEREKEKQKQYDKACSIVIDSIKKFNSINGINGSVELDYQGIFVLDGKEYYSFFSITNGVYSGDSKRLVSVNDFEHFIYYSDDTLWTVRSDGSRGELITSKSRPLEITVSDLAKNHIKYAGNTVKFTGKIIYINESPVNGNMLVCDPNGEVVHVSYIGETNFVKGNNIIVTAMVLGQTNDYTVNGIPRTLTSLSFGEFN